VSALPGRLVLLGRPVAHSLSPALQHAALRAAGIPLRYEALDVLPGDLPAVLRGLVEVSGAGNVTIPHKDAVARACQRLTSVARRTGAVNTFWCEQGGLVGDNTDVAGFEALVQHLLGGPPDGARVALLGAGGGAAAVCAAVARWPGARIRLVNRTAERARSLAARFPYLVTPVDRRAALRDATIVVNATPAGLREGEPFPVPLELIPRDAAVMDLAYRRGETAWIRAARAAGHPAADGLEMLIAQGAHAFERWFGRAPDVGAMRMALAT
jgi:shikimate dehydrogenase